MAWTAPRTWVAGELVTAAQMNTHLRDNLLILKTNIGDDGSLNVSNRLCEGRLTLTTGTPVTTSDVTGATTLRWEPFEGLGEQVLLYDGTSWVITTPGNLTLSNGSLSADTNYDIFIDYNGGSPQLVALAWSSDTARVALAEQDGVFVKGAGDTDHLFVGAVRTDGSTTFEDSLAKRYVWNLFNQHVRPMRVLEGTASWSSGTVDTWRAMNNSSANALDFLLGMPYSVVRARAEGTVSTNRVGRIGIGLDSTTAVATGVLHGENAANVGSAGSSQVAMYSGFPGLGRHRLYALEDVSVAATWYGNGSPGNQAVQSGIAGEVMG